MKRTVIKINEDLCNGCGNCVTGCHEGALRMVDGKAVMISDLYCDGLGACIGDCPVGAITFEKREAQPYDEQAVMERLLPKGMAAVAAHLKHLKDHGEERWFEEGVRYLRGKGIDPDFAANDEKEQPFGCPGTMDRGVKRPAVPGLGIKDEKVLPCGCPGSSGREIKRPAGPAPGVFRMPAAASRSELAHFPVQLALVNPAAPFFRESDLLLAADCTAFASGEFHSRFLKGKTLVIACPKLDAGLALYEEKLKAMIDGAQIKSLTVLIMEVPCCRGLLQVARNACASSARKIPLETIVISVSGDVVG